MRENYFGKLCLWRPVLVCLSQVRNCSPLTGTRKAEDLIKANLCLAFRQEKKYREQFLVLLVLCYFQLQTIRMTKWHNLRRLLIPLLSIFSLLRVGTSVVFAESFSPHWKDWRLFHTTSVLKFFLVSQGWLLHLWKWSDHHQMTLHYILKSHISSYQCKNPVASVM